MKNTPGRPITRMILLLLLTICATATVKAADVKFYEFWNHQLLTTLTPLVPDGSTYTGTFTPASWGSYIIEIDGTKYGFPQETGIGGYNDLPKTVTLNAGDSSRFYVGDTQSNDFGIIVVVNGDNTCTMTLCKVEDLPKADPTPLSMAINGTTIAVSDDINGLSETFTIEGSYEVTDGNSLTIGGISAGGAAYGAQTQPTFTDSKDEQTQTVALVSGGGNISVTRPGIYTVGLSVLKGVPSACVITKASGDKIPLKINIGGNSLIVADDVEGQTGAFNVQGTYKVDAGAASA